MQCNLQVGEFYEAVGIDAVLLVQHAGLNPMADGVPPRAGCPRQNLRRTVADLVGAGLSVCVCEEVSRGQQGTPRWPAEAFCRWPVEDSCSDPPSCRLLGSSAALGLMPACLVLPVCLPHGCRCPRAIPGASNAPSRSSDMWPQWCAAAAALFVTLLLYSACLSCCRCH
jgi:hypothetical protein